MSLLGDTLYEIKITDQVVYDQYMMTLPEFVTYYRELNNFPQVGHSLRDLYFLLQDERLSGRLSLNERLKKNCLTSLLKSKGKATVPGEKPEKKSAEWLKHYNEYMEEEPDHEQASKYADVQVQKTPTKSTSLLHLSTNCSPSIKKEKGSPSRKEQVAALFQSGITDSRQIAHQLSTNPSYVHRLLKEIKNELKE